MYVFVCEFVSVNVCVWLRASYAAATAAESSRVHVKLSVKVDFVCRLPLL